MKNDFVVLFTSLLCALINMIEHLCGLSIALESMCVWAIISLITLIHILVKHVEIRVVEE